MRLRMTMRFLGGLLPLLIGAAALGANPTLVVKPDHASGIYEPGEKVTWTVDVKTGERTGLAALRYTVKKDGQDKVAEGTLDLTAGPATLSGSRTEPGALVVQVLSADKNEPLPLGVGGAIVSPLKIGLSAPEPADFDAFWQAKLKDLAAVPVNPVLEKVDSVKNSEGLEYYKVTLDNIKGTHVRGQLARPQAGDKFPAILVLQYAGVYPLEKSTVIGHAKTGYLALNVSAHDLPIDEPAAFYKDLNEHALKGYIYQGSEDRETSYFLRMFLGCVRAAEYLTSRPDWDGKTLIITGASQGGLQSFATAALFPKASALVTQCPAGCDNYAPLANPPRAFGWPYWLSTWGPKNRDMKKVEKTAGYFDAAYFASRVHCPTSICIGLADETARPAGILAAFNAINAPKEIRIYPTSNHHGSGPGEAAEGYINRLTAWKEALRKGQKPPTAPGGIADLQAK